MLNLLSKEQKEVLHKEYTNRVIVVWLGATLAAFVISLILLAPSYILTRIRASEALVELEGTKQTLDEKLPPGDVVTVVEDAVRSADALRPLVKPKSVFDLVSIFESKPKSITLSKISYQEQTDELPAKMIVQGRAADRESLTTFGKTLEGRVEFESVDIPVSNFVRETDIYFSMTAILKP
jgi:hypothetical protein